MDRITEFTITRIKMQGFKAFAQEREFFFRSTSYISGANGQGKTTIADAIAYAFCGVPFWGEKGIDKLMSKGAKQMCVEVEFVNGDGEIYTLVRRKNGNTTSIALNGNTMTQKSLTALFVEKDIFLSVINPLYFIEKIASDGREFLQKLLPPVSKEAILAVCSEQTRDLLENESLLEPEYYIKNKRAEMKEADDQITYLSGQLALLEEQLENNSVKRNKLETSVKEQKAKISAVMKKQFEGIDVEAVRQEYNEAKKSLSNDEILALERKRMEIQNRPYVSKFSAQRAKIEAELNAARLEYTGLYNKATGIRPGVPCPTCTHALTNEEFNAVRKDITETLANMKKNGANLNSQLDDIVKLDAQAKDQFEQYKADDLKKVEEEIKNVKSATSSDIDRLRDTLTFGNFSEAQVNSLEAMKAELFADESDLNSMRSEEELTKAIETVKLQKKDNEGKKDFLGYLISAVNEYAVKRAEVMLTPLKMDKAAIKLSEVVKGTGEIKDTFKFTYDGKDYRWLSNSERIKAGLEIAMLVKRLTGLTYPTFVDNAESINTNFTRPDGQMIFAFVRRCAITVHEPSPAAVKEAA